VGKITGIKPQKRKNYFNVFIDSRFSFSLSAEGLVKTGLKIGQVVAEEKIKKLLFESQFQKLRDGALHFLSFRPRSEKEIRDYLKKKVYKLKAENQQSDLVDQVIKKLYDQKLVDDQGFAVWWCQQRAKFRPRGERAILMELRQKGVEEEVAREALKECFNEEESIAKLVAKKQKSWQKFSSRERRQKMGQYLFRLGFSWPSIRSAIDSLEEKG